MNRTLFGYLFLIFSFLFLFSACDLLELEDQNKEITQEEEKLQVFTTLFPLQDFAEKIGGDHVQVISIIPPGVDPHDFEPTPQDLIKLSKADLFLYSGSGFESSWIDTISSMVDKERIKGVSDDLDLLRVDEKVEEGSHHHNHDHSHGQYDPHVWLDPTLAKKQALAIKDTFIKVDQKNKTDYEERFHKLADELDQLDQEFKEMASKAKKKKFIVSHQAFAYLANRYQLTQVPIAGLSPSDEPSAKELEKIVEMIKEHQIKYIFFESLVNPSVAQTVQKEAKVESLVLYSLEGLSKEEIDAGEDYISMMQKNKEHLAKALESQP